MLIASYKECFFRVCEVIEGGAGDLPEDVDANILLQLDLLLSRDEINDFSIEKNEFCLIIPNYFIDLSEDEEVLFQKIKKNARKAINRAINKDGFTYLATDQPTEEEVDEFVAFYNTYAAARNLKKCNKERLMSYQQKKALYISFIKDENNELICAHLNIFAGKQVYCLYSALKVQTEKDSSFSQVLGRANRYMEWKNILESKRRGYYWYNFGGQIIDEDDKNGQNVNRYKQKYAPKMGYDLRRYKATTPFGKIMLFLLYLKWKNKAEYKYTRELLKSIDSSGELVNSSIYY